MAIRHYPTNRRVNCEYNDDVEELLVKNRRGLLRVTGVLELDHRDRPVRMTDVFEINELDISPITLTTIDAMDRRLGFRSGSHNFHPALDADGQLLVIEDDALDLHAYAPDRTSLIADVSEQIVFMWREYVESETELTPGAAALAKRLVEVVEVAPNA